MRYINYKPNDAPRYWGCLVMQLFVLMVMLHVTLIPVFAAQTEESRLTPEFIEYLAEIESADTKSLDILHFDEVYQMLKHKLKEVVLPQKGNDNKSTKDENHADQPQK